MRWRRSSGPSTRLLRVWVRQVSSRSSLRPCRVACTADCSSWRTGKSGIRGNRKKEKKKSPFVPQKRKSKGFRTEFHFWVNHCLNTKAIYTKSFLLKPNARLLWQLWKPQIAYTRICVTLYDKTVVWGKFLWNHEAHSCYGRVTFCLGDDPQMGLIKRI